MIKRSRVLLVVIVALVMVLGIGFAAITSTQLGIKGNVTATPEQANFIVKFLSETQVSDPGKATAEVTGDTTATINVQGLTAKGETETATYKVKNFSADLSADLLLETTNNNEEYFKITAELGKESLTAGEETTATVTVELIKTLIENDENATIEIEITANPVQPGEEGNTGGTGGTGGEEEEINNLVDMFRKAETDGCINEDGLCDNKNHLHIGDYVNYQNPSSGSYTITGDKSGINANQTYSIANNQLNWRVLGIDETTEGIKLIAGSPMKLDNIEGKEHPYLFMSGAHAYAYGPTEFNNACKMYKNEYAVEARSITINDINQIAGIQEEDISTYNIIPQNVGSGYGIYGSEYEAFGWTPEGWINGEEETTLTGNVTGYAYIIGDRPIQEFENAVIIQNTRAKNMLFDNIMWSQQDKYTQGKNYWLASRGVYTSEARNAEGIITGLSYCVGGVTQTNEEYNMWAVGNVTSMSVFEVWSQQYGDELALRPVVILQSNITKDQISKIADKTEETWNYTYETWFPGYYE